MTAKLLPEFLKCFNDQYMSIRCECCITSGNIKIQEAQVVDMLVSLAKYDPIWKVKALAIQGKFETSFSLTINKFPNALLFNRASIKYD